MEIKDIEWLIKKSWCKDTCYPLLKDKWEESDPSYGQSLVTSLVVNDFFGGDITKCMSSTGVHYYNLIEGKIIDLTVTQFHGESILYGDDKPLDKEELLNKDDNRDRYYLFLENIKENSEKLTNIVSNVMDNNSVKEQIRIKNRKV